jgi:hypothetical protein
LKDVERFTTTTIWRLGHHGHRGTWWGISEDLDALLGQYVRALVLLALIPVIGPLAAGVVAIGVGLFSGYAHPWLLAVFVLV